MKKLSAAATVACVRLLGEPVLYVENPGGRSRDSARVRLERGTVIATRRKSWQRSSLEFQVLRALGDRGASVPKVLAYDGAWIIQEDLGPTRLAQVIARTSPAECEHILNAALASLVEIHEAGRSAELHRKMSVLGDKPSWIKGLADTPNRIGRYLDAAAPYCCEAAIAKRLAVREPWFLKWDARPGNAIVRRNLSVAWFDWEHSGCRNRLDDLVWLLADEYLLDDAELEKRILQRHLQVFAPDWERDDAISYLHTFGTLHMCARLALILKNKRSGPWWDEEYCLAHDKVRVTAKSAEGICRRAARWAAASPELKALAPWLGDLAERFASAEEAAAS